MISSIHEILSDTCYWIALLKRSDQYHLRAIELNRELRNGTQIVTSELVLIELLNYFSGHGTLARERAIELESMLRNDVGCTIVGATDDLLARARGLYLRYADKSWSLTDCASFVIMEERNIRDALTYDHHFNQAGFRALMRDNISA